MTTSAGILTRASLALALAIAAGCGGGAAGPAVGISSSKPKTAADAAAAAAVDDGLLPSHALGALDHDGSVAALARSPGGRSLLVFASGGALRARPLDARGTPLGEVTVLAPLAGAASHVAVRATGDGFLVAWGAAAGEGHVIASVALDGSGAPRAEVAIVAQVPERVAFVDLVVWDGGALVVHELAGRGPRGLASRVVATPIDPGRGVTRGPAVVVADDVAGWNVTTTRSGAAIARVVAPPPAADAPPGPVLGRIEVASIGADGATGKPVVVLTQPTANIDVEVAAVGERLLVGWTDGAGGRGVPTVASVDATKGTAGSPRRLTAGSADAALVGLWSAARGAGARALVGWETIDPARPPDATRTFTLAALAGDGAADPPRMELPFVGPGRPDVVADGDGFAALILAPSEDGAEAAVWPTFVRLDRELHESGLAPLRAEAFAATDGVPDLAFGLGCSAGACVAIGGAAGAPAPLAAITLWADGADVPAAVRGDAASPPGATPPAKRPAVSPSPAAVPTASGSTAPRAAPGPDRTSLLWSGGRIAGVDAARLDGGAEMVAWVTHLDPGSSATPPPRRGEAPYAATLAVRPIAGGPATAPLVISQRAAPAGGVALAPVAGSPGEALLGWVASEDGVTQVFATRLDAAGKKVAQKKVTVVERGPRGTRSGALAVDLAYAPQAADGRPGVVVAWIDTRDRDAEVYAARLDARLQKVGADRRITAAAGAATEVRVLVRGAETWLAFVEARGGATGGDVHLVRVHTGNLEAIGEPVRVHDTEGAARDLRFVEGPGGRVFLSWIDAPGAGSTGGDVGPRLVEIVDGKPAAAPRRLATVGHPAAAAVACGGGPCRAVLAQTGGAPRIVALELDGQALASPRELGPFSGGGALVAPVAADGAAFVFADDHGGGGRLRLVRPGG